MAKNNSPTPMTNSDSGMVLVMSYFTLLASSALVIYLGNMYYPQQVVLGTMSMTAAWAILHSASKLALLGTLAIPFVHEVEKMRNRMFNSQEWMAVYFLINVLGIWLVTRFSDQYGMGVKSWYVVVAMAIVLDIVQGMAMMALEKFRR